MDLGIKGRRYMVGGGSRGLGAAVARALASEGAVVAVTARASAELDASAAAIHGIAIGADLSTADGPADAVRRAAGSLGGLDGLVVNTGGPPAGTFAELDEAAWERAINGTLQSSLRVIRAALPLLRDGRDPSILVILSSSVREPIAGLMTSNVLRPGLAGLIKGLVEEIAPIRINGIAPGRFDTERVRSLDIGRAERAGTSVESVQTAMRARIPLGRYGEADELGRVAAFLLSPAASYVDGVIIGVDGGMIRSLP